MGADRFAAKIDGTEWWEVAAVEPQRLLTLRMSMDLAWIMQTRQFANLKRRVERG